MEQQNCLEEITESENPLWGGNDLRSEDLSEKNFKETRKGLNRQKQKMTPNPAMIFGQWKETSFCRHPV